MTEPAVKAASWTSFVTSILTLAVVGLLGIVRSQDVQRIQSLEEEVKSLQLASQKSIEQRGWMRAYMLIICEQGCDTRDEVYQLRDDLFKTTRIVRKACSCPKLDMVDATIGPSPRPRTGG